MHMGMYIGARWQSWRRIWIIRSSVVSLLFLCCLSVVCLTQSYKKRKCPQHERRGASSLFSSCLTRQQYAAKTSGPFGCRQKNNGARPPCQGRGQRRAGPFRTIAVRSPRTLSRLDHAPPPPCPPAACRAVHGAGAALRLQHRQHDARSRAVRPRTLPAGSDWRETLKPFRVRAQAGARPERLTDAQLDSVAPLIADGVLSSDRARRIVSVRGDLYVIDLRKSAVRRLTETLAMETNPRFSSDGARALFIRDGNAFSVDLGSGLVRQLTDIRAADAPGGASGAGGGLAGLGAVRGGGAGAACRRAHSPRNPPAPTARNFPLRRGPKSEKDRAKGGSRSVWP